jgi:hypothetical protein
VGVDLSPGVLQVAQARVKRHGWGNVELVNASIAEFAPGVGQHYLDDKARTHALWSGFTLARRRDQRRVK